MRKSSDRSVSNRDKYFYWSILGTVASVIFLTLCILFHDGAQARVDALEKDPRYAPAAWAELTADEQKEAGREQMSARNNLGQIEKGKYLFSITLTISLVALIVFMVRGRRKDEEAEETHET